MPFSSLNDPVDLARTLAALEAAWNEVGPKEIIVAYNVECLPK